MRVPNEQLLERISEYITEYQKANLASPSQSQITENCEISSQSKTSRYLELLAQRGSISKNVNGSIELPDNLFPLCTIAHKVGSISCGKPLDAVENIEESYILPTSIFGGGELFVLTASGDSMNLLGIDDGDLVVVKKAMTARDGDIVAVMTEDYETTLKEIRYYDRYAELIPHSDNDVYKSFKLTNFTLLGVAQKVIKSI